jgi:hypothetical protein
LAEHPTFNVTRKDSQVKDHEEMIDFHDRYQVKLTRVRWGYQAQLVTNHVIHDMTGEPIAVIETERDDAPVRPLLAWARWKGRRMINRAHRKDVREKQPWATDDSRTGSHRAP